MGRDDKVNLLLFSLERGNGSESRQPKLELLSIDRGATVALKETQMVLRPRELCEQHPTFVDDLLNHVRAQGRMNIPIGAAHVEAGAFVAQYPHAAERIAKEVRRRGESEATKPGDQVARLRAEYAANRAALEEVGVSEEEFLYSAQVSNGSATLQPAVLEQETPPMTRGEALRQNPLAADLCRTA